MPMQPSSPRPHTFNYPALRVANPSLPVTPPLDIVEKKKRSKRPKADSPAARAQARFRPAGYTSSGAWLQESSVEHGPQRMVSMAFPNPHGAEVEYYAPNPHAYPSFSVDETREFTLLQPPSGTRGAVPSAMYNEGQDRFRVERGLLSAAQRDEVPIIRGLRHMRTPMGVSASSSGGHRGALPPENVNGHDMRMSHSQPSSMYNHHVQGSHDGRYPTSRSTGVSAIVNEYHPPAMTSRRSTSRAYSTSQTPPLSSASRSRALRLDVHGLSFVDEEAESTFPPVEQNHGYLESDNFTGRSGNGSAPMQAVPSDKLTPWRPRAHRDSLHQVKEKQLQRAVVTCEPQAQRGMRVVVGNRNAKGMPYAADGTRDWSTDLCLFCDHNLGTCCKALWCPCIVYGRNKARIEHLYEVERVHPKRGGMCSVDCAVHACLTFCLFGWAIQVPNRAAVRRRYAIEGDCVGDCAATLFCSSCELAQESREIDLEEGSFPDSGTWARRDVD